jgi:hypothetical protein
MRKFTITESEREQIRGLYEQSTQPNPSTNVVNEVITNMSKGIFVFKSQSLKNTIITASPKIERGSDGGNRIGTHSFNFLEYVLGNKVINELGVDVLLNATPTQMDIDSKNLSQLINSKQVTIARINQPTPHFDQTYPILYHTFVRTYKLQPQQAVEIFESTLPGSGKILFSQLSNAQYDANSPEEKAMWDKYISLIKPLVGV